MEEPVSSRGKGALLASRLLGRGVGGRILHSAHCLFLKVDLLLPSKALPSATSATMCGWKNVGGGSYLEVGVDYCGHGHCSNITQM